MIPADRFALSDGIPIGRGQGLPIPKNLSRLTKVKKGLHAAFLGVFSRPVFQNPHLTFTMSQHRSLKTAGSVGTKRSVLKRGERIKLLKSRGLWKEGRLPTSLPKTKPD